MELAVGLYCKIIMYCFNLIKVLASHFYFTRGSMPPYNVPKGQYSREQFVIENCCAFAFATMKNKFGVASEGG